MSQRKKKVLFQSDSCLAKTGFGRSAKEVLLYLHKTGKYDIVEYCCSKHWSMDAEHKRKPWPSYGTVPDNMMELNAIAPTDQHKRMVAYGSHYLDRIITQEKPDVYFAVQDIWGIDFAVDKPWFDKMTSVLWTTLDSLPITKMALDIAPKVKNFWVWSSFAEVAMKKLGHSHIRTVHGAIDPSEFSRLNNQMRAQLRHQHGIPQDAFVIGFVFRNQPRKSLPRLLDGFKIFKTQNPHIKNPRLLLHTYWNEGWDIHTLAKEYKIPNEEVITTHICNKCRSYRVQKHDVEGVQCPYCGDANSFVTTSPGNGVSEQQLNEVYNMMDVYCHPFTSGGQEIPVQEAKFAELITLVTNYSCGEEMCSDGAGSLPLEWQEYREPDSLFIKATTSSFSIGKQLTKVAKMKPEDRLKLGKQGREWALKNFSAEAIGSILEKFIDEAPYSTYDFPVINENPNPFAPVNNELPNEEWILDLYDTILGRKVDKYDSGVRNWLEHLKRGAQRPAIENFFRQQAANVEVAKRKQAQFDKLELTKKEKRILYVIPASDRDVFLSTSLFRSIKEQYPEHKLYVATEPQYRGSLDGNPYVDEVLVYYQEMDNLMFLEGSGTHRGFFDIAFLPHLHTQRVISYVHNGLTKIAYGKCIEY
jgi:glycosyltransferase involved in cell wall biosynthesis